MTRPRIAPQARARKGSDAWQNPADCGGALAGPKESDHGAFILSKVSLQLYGLMSGTCSILGRMALDSRASDGQLSRLRYGGEKTGFKVCLMMSFSRCMRTRLHKAQLLKVPIDARSIQQCCSSLAVAVGCDVAGRSGGPCQRADVSVQVPLNSRS